MRQEPNRDVVMLRILLLASVVIIGVCLYTLVSTLSHLHDTGLLRVSTSDEQATLSVSAASRQAKIIGRGTAKVRLIPGTYLIFASNGNSQASEIVRISKEQAVNSRLKLSGRPVLPSVENINFEGTDVFIDSGITSAQLGILRHAFFQYKPTARIVSIKSDTIKPGPHDRNSDSPFTITFSVAIDDAPYQATIGYTGLDTVRLYLYNQTGSLVFDSGATDTQPGD